MSELDTFFFNSDKTASKTQRIEALETALAKLGKQVDFIVGEHVDLLAKHAKLRKEHDELQVCCDENSTEIEKARKQCRLLKIRMIRDMTGVYDKFYRIDMKIHDLSKSPRTNCPLYSLPKTGD
jgi:hypothetical protein